MEGERCPCCGGKEWDIDYIFDGENENRVENCAGCGWPPGSPMSPEEYRELVAGREGAAEL